MSVPMMFGRFLVMKGKITERDLEETLQIQSELNRSLAEELLEGDHLSLESFKKAWYYQREHLVTLKEAVIALNLMKEDELEKIEVSCSDRHIRIGELLVQKGILKEQDLKDLLREFRERGYAKES